MNRKKLSFRKETVRNLSKEALLGPRGGGTSGASSSNEYKGCSTEDETKCGHLGTMDPIRCGGGTFDFLCGSV